ALKVGQLPQLGRRMPLYRKRRILPAHPVPVVPDADQRFAARVDLDEDAARAGIEGVLHELLDDGSGSLHDLARCDLVDQVLVKAFDSRHAGFVSRLEGARVLGSRLATPGPSGSGSE